MKKHTLPVLLLLAGCHDFEGELGQLGFSSSLITRPGQPWTPAQPNLIPFAAPMSAPFLSPSTLFLP